MHSLPQWLAFKACGADRVKEVIEVCIVVSWHLMFVLLAVRAVIVVVMVSSNGNVQIVL